MAKKQAKAKKPQIKPEPAPVGRPTAYRPEFCEMLIKHMAQGLSFETFGATLRIDMPNGTKVGVDRDTLYEWEKVHPEFSDAKRRAFMENLLFYEKIGVMAMAGKVPGFNATAWVFNMKNRHRWRDQVPAEADSTKKGYETALEDALEALKPKK